MLLKNFLATDFDTSLLKKTCHVIHDESSAFWVHMCVVQRSKVDQSSWANMAVTLLWRPQSLVTILLARLLILSILSFSLLVCGSQTTQPHSADDLTKAKYATALHCLGQYFRLHLTKLRVLLAFLVILSTCCPHSNLLLYVIARYFACSTSSYDLEKRNWDLWIRIMLHLDGLNRMPHLFAQASSADRSRWKMTWSSSDVISL